jgi:hypothetical protein
MSIHNVQMCDSFVIRVQKENSRIINEQKNKKEKKRKFIV